MKTKTIFLFISIIFALGCKKEPLNVEAELSKPLKAGDVLELKGTIQKYESIEWGIKVKETDAPLCPVIIGKDSTWNWNALPDTLKVEGTNVDITVKILEPPADLRLNCVLIEIISIQKI